MREYPDVQHHLDASIERAAGRYLEAIQQTGLAPNDTLTRAIAEQTLHDAEASYTQEAAEIRDHNIEVILERHYRGMNAVKREGAKLRLITCPPIALLFGVLAWYSFQQSAPAGVMMGLLLSIGSLAFLLMLVLGAIFDRPRPSPSSPMRDESFQNREGCR